MARPRKIGGKPPENNPQALTVHSGNGGAGGRPSKYNPKYCDEIIAFMVDGASLAEFAVHIGVARSTIDEWVGSYPEFSVAKREAVSVAQAWWEELGRRIAMGEGPIRLKSRKVVVTKTPTTVLVSPAKGKGKDRVKAVYKTTYIEVETVTEEWVPAAGGSTGAWVFNMINRFPNDWRQRGEVSGPGGGPIPMNSVTLHANLDTNTLRQLREIWLNGQQPRVVN